MRWKLSTWLSVKAPPTIWTDWGRVQTWVAVWLIVVGCIYVTNAWSPSSYGHVLQVAGAANDGLVFGTPRAIRSDEWSVTTPLTQAAVNNGFERFNKTSYYNEDLRINYGLPLHDWGLVFKPTLWGYFFLPPATAFSLHYFLMFAIFVAGYAQWMRIAGANAVQGYALSVALYFCGFVQFFWNSNASLFAFFPWVIVALCSRWPTATRLLVYYWVACCWLIGTFYPPLFISLGFVALVFLAAYRPDVLRPRSLWILGVVTALACGTAIVYLWDYLTQTLHTVYPGQRTSVAGYYPRFIFLTQLWPAELFDADFRESVNFTNVTGVGTVGLYWALAALSFANWSDWKKLASISTRTTMILVGGLLLTMLWMYAPMPPWFGQVLLWDRVPPERMAFASGLLWVVVVWHVTNTLGVKPSIPRFVSYAVAVVAGVVLFESLTREYAGAWRHWLDLIVIPLMGVAAICAVRFRAQATTAFLLAGAVTGCAVFGRFNPVQSANAIFERQPNAMTRTLDTYVDKEGVLPVQRDGLIGATLNGMGYKAVAHLVALPPMALWQQKFGPLSSENEFIFNRYAHVRISPTPIPRKLENDQIGVPAASFRAQPTLVMSHLRNFTEAVNEPQGAIDEVTQDGHFITIRGWAPWTRKWRDRQLLLETASEGLVLIAVSDQERWDVVQVSADPDRLLSGFVIQLHMDSPTVNLGPFRMFARDGAQGQLYPIPGKNS